MGSKKFAVQTYTRFNYPVIEFRKRILDDKNNSLKINPGGQDEYEKGVNSTSIDIHKIEDNGNKFTYLRELTSTVTVELIPEWINREDFNKKIKGILFEEESPEDALRMNVRIWCPEINYVIDTIMVDLEYINTGKPIIFNKIDLADSIGKIEINSNLVRTRGSNKHEFNRTNSKLSVIAKNADIVFYIDAIARIGGNFLNILPTDLKKHLFGFNNEFPFGTQIPELEYHKDLEEYFNNGDDYNSVKILMIMIGPIYCDKILKWILFGNPDFENPQHKAVISYIGDLCNMKESLFTAIADESEELKVRKYSELSDIIFKNIQIHNLNWKDFLSKIIKTEKN